MKLADTFMDIKDIKKKLLKLYKKYSFVYGPYKRKDGRKHVVLYSSYLNKRKTISWPKAKLEVKLKRRLIKEETADHIDEDHTNNRYINLQVLSRVANAIKNIKSGKRKPSRKFAEDNPQTKLSRKDVKRIRKLYEFYTQKELGKMFGVHLKYIGCIVRGTSRRKG